MKWISIVFENISKSSSLIYLNLHTRVRKQKSISELHFALIHLNLVWALVGCERFGQFGEHNPLHEV